jgi:hypothetical protein
VCVPVRALKVGCGLRGALGSGKTCLPRLQALPPARASRFYGSATVVRDGYLVEEYAAARRSAELPAATRYGAASAASLAGHRLEHVLRASGGCFACGTPCTRRTMSCSCALCALLCTGVRLDALGGWRSAERGAGRGASLSLRHARFSASTALQPRRIQCSLCAGRRAHRAGTPAPALSRTRKASFSVLGSAHLRHGALAVGRRRQTAWACAQRHQRQLGCATSCTRCSARRRGLARTPNGQQERRCGRRCSPGRCIRARARRSPVQRRRQTQRRAKSARRQRSARIQRQRHRRCGIGSRHVFSARQIRRKRPRRRGISVSRVPMRWRSRRSERTTQPFLAGCARGAA